MKNSATVITSIIALFIVTLGCSKLASVGVVNMFEADNAAKAAAAIKEKVHSDNIKVIRAEVRKNSMSITIQSPDNPRNMDEYVYEKGSVTGPKPVQAMSIGNLDMTAEKYTLTDIGDINFAAIPQTAQKAIASSGLDGGQIDLISMEDENSSTIHPKTEADKKRDAEELKKKVKEKQDECSKLTASNDCSRQLFLLQTGFANTKLELGWRIFVESPRGRKDFYAYKHGEIVDKK